MKMEKFSPPLPSSGVPIRTFRFQKSAKKDYPVELKKLSTNSYNLRFKEDTMSQDYDGDAEENFEKLRKRKPLHRAAKAKR